MNEGLKNKMKSMFNDNLKFDEPMSSHTTYGIGGSAEIFANPGTVEELIDILGFADEYGIEVFLVGSGSNVLVSDEGITGMVISLAKTFKKLEISETGEIYCESGVMTGTLVKNVMKMGFTGMESLIGVPGTVGGALVMNAGAYGTEISNCVTTVNTVNLSGYKKSYTVDELEFSYRHSSFHWMDEIITSVLFKCEKGKPDEIQELKSKASAARKASQPLRFRSAGSVFKNPAGDKPAGYLIDQAGLKGMSRGGAQISEKHANFIINKGHATSDDMLHLITLAQKRVAEKFNIKLELEIQLLGFSDNGGLNGKHVKS